MKRETSTFATPGETVAEALRLGRATGNPVVIHDEKCEGREDSDPPFSAGCTCTPLVMRAGARA